MFGRRERPAFKGLNQAWLRGSLLNLAEQSGREGGIREHCSKRIFKFWKLGAFLDLKINFRKSKWSPKIRRGCWRFASLREKERVVFGIQFYGVHLLKPALFRTSVSDPSAERSFALDIIKLIIGKLLSLISARLRPEYFFWYFEIRTRHRLIMAFGPATFVGLAESTRVN